MIIQNVLDNIKVVRWIKGGHWVKTKERGWITWDCYEDYLSYLFDPKYIKSKEYKKRIWTN